MRAFESDSWAPEGAIYPKHGSLEEQLRFMVCYADLAPQIYPDKPWRFDVLEDAIEVHINPNRRLRTADPDGREAIIGIGAAVFFIYLGMRAHGFDTQTVYRPDPSRQKLMVQVECVGESTPTVHDLQLLSQIPRRSSAALIRPAELSPCEVELLTKAATYEHTQLRWIEEAQLRSLILEIVQEGDDIAFDSPDCAARFQDWIAPAARKADPKSSHWLVPDLHGDFFGTGRIGVLSTPHDDFEDWLNAGQALARLELAATEIGCRLQIFNQPFQIRGLRSKFMHDSGIPGSPQALLIPGPKRYDSAVIDTSG